MSDKNRNKKRSIADFLRYRRNEMTGEERNSFERELQKDPFADEASEGFASIPAEEVSKDISRLHKRIENRTRGKHGFLYYRIAASVAVLMVIATLFIITQRNNKDVTTSENISQNEIAQVTTPVPEPLPIPSDKGPDKKVPVSPSGPQKEKAADQTAGMKVVEQEVKELFVAESQEKIEVSEDNKPDLSGISSREIPIKYLAEEKRMDMARAAVAPANAKSKLISDYIPPQPVIGKDSFDLYLEKNIRNPDTAKLSQNVVLSFIVKLDSTANEIKIISSPGQIWSVEAIRLIEEGPAWKPAEQSGKLIEAEVRVSIIFR